MMMVGFVMVVFVVVIVLVVVVMRQDDIKVRPRDAVG